MYRENARFSFLLGCAYLYREDTGGAYGCFRRAQNLDFRNPDNAFGLAAVLIRRGETDKAVQLYIDILERSPGHPRAGAALDYVRRNADPAGSGQAGNAARRILYPQPPLRRTPFVVAAVLAAATLAAVLAAPLLPSLAEAVRSSNPARPGIGLVSLDPEERASPVTASGDFSVVLTEKEALDAFDRAKRLFLEYRDEAALVEINRLRLSNASGRVKAKAESLALYVREPSFLSMPDRFSYAEVSANPALFEGVAVLWKGMPANVASILSPASTASGDGSADDATAFDFLVGYHDMQRLEGIVPVLAAFRIKLDPDRPLEVLGRVRATEGNSGGFRLECVAVHQ